MNINRLSEARLRSFRKHLRDWYLKSRRKLPWRETSNPYHIWISEVMLQQTQVTTVTSYYESFLKRFPDLAQLAKADLQSVLKQWEGLGYYARARNLHKAARMVVKELGGNIPSDYREFRKLPGVGEYIAAAVQSIAFGLPYAVVDGNVKRVLARLFEIKLPVNEASAARAFRDTAAALLDEAHPGDYNQAMMELGATLCRPQNPLCEHCPVHSFCSSFASGRQHEYPVKAPKKKTPQYHLAVGVVRKDGRFLITRRAEEGLLGGLWEFPGGRLRKGESTGEACLRRMKEAVNLEVGIAASLTRVKHAYTHFGMVMEVFLCDYVSGEVVLKEAVDYRWITLQEIANYPFHKANHKFIPLLKARCMF